MFRQLKLLFLVFLALDFVSYIHNLKVEAGCPKKKCPASATCPHEDKDAKAKPPAKEKGKQCAKEKSPKEKCAAAGSKTTKTATVAKIVTAANEIIQTPLHIKPVMMKISCSAEKVSSERGASKSKN